MISPNGLYLLTAMYMLGICPSYAMQRPLAKLLQKSTNTAIALYGRDNNQKTLAENPIYTQQSRSSRFSSTSFLAGAAVTGLAIWALTDKEKEDAIKLDSWGDDYVTRQKELIAKFPIFAAHYKNKLYTAVKKSDFIGARNILRLGINPNEQHASGALCLNKAVQNHDCGMIQLLLEFGANPENKDYWNRSAYHLAQSDRNLIILLMEPAYKRKAQQEAKENSWFRQIIAALRLIEFPKSF